VENNPGGEWNTSTSADVMNSVLAFIYTGTHDNALMEANQASVLSVASKYQIPDLVYLCEACCIRCLENLKIKAMIQLAKLLGSCTLKEACFKFIGRNSSSILMESRVSWLLRQKKMENCGRNCTSFCLQMQRLLALLPMIPRRGAMLCLRNESAQEEYNRE